MKKNFKVGMIVFIAGQMDTIEQYPFTHPDATTNEDERGYDIVLKNAGTQVSDNVQPLESMTINNIAILIRKNWPKVYFGAVPYLEAMSTLSDINDDYGQDSGKSIVRYFLSNATTWRGEVAKAVKAELNKRLK